MTKKLVLLLLAGFLSSSPLWAKTAPSLRLVLLQPSFSPNNDEFKDYLTVNINSEGLKKISNWELKIEDSGGVTRRTLTGKDKMPASFIWNGVDDFGASCVEGNYQISLTAWDSKQGGINAPSETVRLDITPPIVSLIKDKNSPESFIASAVDLSEIDTWNLEIQDSKGQLLYVKDSSGPVPTRLTWTPKEIPELPAKGVAILFTMDNAGNRGQSPPVNFGFSDAPVAPQDSTSAPPKYMQMTVLISIADLFGPKATRRSELMPEAEAILAPLARTLAENPGAKAIILGHVDAQASPKNAYRLSGYFSRKIHDFFSKQSSGDIKKVTVKGLGQKFPLSRKNTAVARARNRRIEIQIFIPKSAP